MDSLRLFSKHTAKPRSGRTEKRKLVLISPLAPKSRPCPSQFTGIPSSAAMVTNPHPIAPFFLRFFPVPHLGSICLAGADPVHPAAEPAGEDAAGQVLRPARGLREAQGRVRGEPVGGEETFWFWCRILAPALIWAFLTPWWCFLILGCCESRCTGSW